MRIKIWTIAAFVLLVILVSFYFFDHLGDGENSRALGVTLTKVNESNPADDARQNILNGDTRYIGLMGYGVYCRVYRATSTPTIIASLLQPPT